MPHQRILQQRLVHLEVPQQLLQLVSQLQNQEVQLQRIQQRLLIIHLGLQQLRLILLKQQRLRIILAEAQIQYILQV